MKYIKLFEAFKSSLVKSFFKGENFNEFFRNYCSENDIKMSEINDIENDAEIMRFVSAIEGIRFSPNKEKINEELSHTCPDCDGDGNVECRDCDGNGTIDCPDCDGSGKDSDDDDCSNCDGNGTIDCSDCDGSGLVDCQSCDGSGEIDDDDNEELEEKEENPDKYDDEIKNISKEVVLPDKYLKLFFTEKNGLIIVTDTTNRRLDKSIDIRYGGKSFWSGTDIDRYTDYLSEEQATLNTDYCLLINTTLLLSKYSGLADLKQRREEAQKDIAANRTNDEIRDANIDRYESILFGKYGFYTTIDDFKKGVKLFNKKLFSVHDPIWIMYEISDFRNLFDYIGRYYRDLETKEQDEEVSWYRDRIKSELKDLFRKNSNVIKIHELDIDDFKIRCKDESPRKSEQIDSFFDEAYPLIQHFNQEFNLDFDIQSAADITSLVYKIKSIESIKSDMGVGMNIIQYLYKDNAYYFTQNIAGSIDIQKSWNRKLKLFLETVLKTFKK